MADDSDNDKIAIAFDIMEWAEIMAALAKYKIELDPAAATNSLFDVTRIMRRIDAVMSGEEASDG